MDRDIEVGDMVLYNNALHLVTESPDSLGLLTIAETVSNEVIVHQHDVDTLHG